MEKLNKNLNKLYELVKELKTDIPSVDYNDDWDDVFGTIADLETALSNVANNEDIIPNIYKVEIIFEAEGTENDLSTMYNNLDNYYPEFLNNYDMEKYKCNKTKKPIKKHHCHFFGIWTGDINKCIRLTHHAEGLYENTNLEYVHVEVCINGKWY